MAYLAGRILEDVHACIVPGAVMRQCPSYSLIQRQELLQRL